MEWESVEGQQGSSYLLSEWSSQSPAAALVASWCCSLAVARWSVKYVERNLWNKWVWPDCVCDYFISSSWGRQQIDTLQQKPQQSGAETKQNHKITKKEWNENVKWKWKRQRKWNVKWKAPANQI